MKASRVVHVEIHGQRYAVRSDLDPAYITELAMYFDEKMKLASTEIQTADSLCLAVIAALNVADELFRARAAGDGLGDEVRARTAAIERIVDSALSNVRITAAVAGS
jgi:cell division protein ZapA